MSSPLAGERQWIKSELDSSVDFWLRHGMDSVHGGIYTCLDREGNVFSTDKSVWMQGRCAWTFSRLCRQYGAREEWLSAAKSCLEFMEEHCINRQAGGRMYFTVTEEGRPLRQRRYFFSECFYVMANAEYYAVTGERVCLDRARAAFDLVWALQNGAPDPCGLGPKTIAETRSGHGLDSAMLCLFTAETLIGADPEGAELYEARAKESVEAILKYNWRHSLGALLDFVGPEGEFMYSVTAGRNVTPGSGFELSWFLMDRARRLGDNALFATALDIMNSAFNIGLDEEYGGIRYFVDCLGKPPEAYEHDMKLWWVHLEALNALLTAYRFTGDKLYLSRYLSLSEYCREHFSDPDYGEWFGYLRRDGAPTEPPCKGSTFKGPFHLPRFLMRADCLLGELEESEKVK